RIRDRAELDGLSPAIERCISDEFDAETLAARLCPVLMTDHTVALFALIEYVGSDQADELMRRVLAKGYLAAQPGRFALDAPLLLAVARNDFLRSGHANAALRRPHSRTALTDAFQDLIEWGVRH